MTSPSPDRDADTRLRPAPRVSRLLVVINVVVYALMVLADLANGTATLVNSPSDAVFLEFGGLYVPSIADGEWWRLVTPNFIHLGLVHLLFNCVALHQIGPTVEAIYGPRKFLSLYVAMGVVSSVCSYGWGINGAGASGAIFGLIGLMAVYGFRIGGVGGRALMREMITWAAFSVVMTLGFGNQAAHVGGFLAGAFLGLVVAAEPPSSQRSAMLWGASALGATALVAASFGMVATHYGHWRGVPMAGRRGALACSGYIVPCIVTVRR